MATHRVARQRELACGAANCAWLNGPPACLGAHDIAAFMRIRAGHQEPPRRDREVVVAKTFHFPLPLVSRLFPAGYCQLPWRAMRAPHAHISYALSSFSGLFAWAVCPCAGSTSAPQWLSASVAGCRGQGKRAVGQASDLRRRRHGPKRATIYSVGATEAFFLPEV